MARDSQGVSFAAVLAAFNGRVDDLKQLAMLRDAEPTATRESFEQLEAMVTAVERQLHHAQLKVQEEAAAIAPAHALLAQMEHQRRHLQHVSQHLPQRLPGCPPPPLTNDKENSASNALSVPLDVNNNSGVAAVAEKPVASRASEAAAPRPTTGRKKKAAELPVPRHYVTVTELNSVSSYMRGRITQDKVNAAVDDLANLAEETARRVAALAAGKKPRGVDEETLRVLKVLLLRSEVKGQAWFQEGQLKAAQQLKPDNTGKALLTLLRHLGRVSELRLPGLGQIFVLARLQM